MILNKDHHHQDNHHQDDHHQDNHHQDDAQVCFALLHHPLRARDDAEDERP